MKPFLVCLCFFVLLGQLAPAGVQQPPEIDLFFQAAGKDQKKAAEALDEIAAGWQDAYTGLILDLTRFMRPRQSTHPTAKIRKRLIRFLKDRTGKNFGDNLDQWRQWLWSLPYSPHPNLIYFKAKLYLIVDPKMSLFFKPGSKTTIRLDEIDWGGVKVNGIPPLDHIPVLPANAAGYLNDTDVDFGLTIEGEARAYPQRIIAWHEMVLDRLGGQNITLVYCTLCGAAIPFNSECGDKKRHFGTSGLLYRSNKLMFDRDTNSLWSALTGEPVLGKLVGKGLRLEVFPLVVTTWGEWKKHHPHTTVLSRQTGFTRDYREGAAYRNYFATDRLMFPVSKVDRRLKNKSVVLVMRLQKEGPEEQKTALAIYTGLLKKRPLFQVKAAGKNLVVITSAAGAHRVYHAGNVLFKKLSGDKLIIDSETRTWEIKEPFLQMRQYPAIKLARIPAHLAFWFGWYAQFPDTLLIK